MEHRKIRAAPDRHRAAADAIDLDGGQHDIYREDAVRESPRSGERLT
jgi:hypothetical protein